MSFSFSSLCNSCGLCCNGVLFPTVHLQPSDSSQELKSLGMHIERKKKYHFFHQPCSSFKKNCCSIYEQRPERCRLFECRQLKNLRMGATTAEKVLEKIQEAQTRVTAIQALMSLSGRINPKKPLSKQYEKIIAEPVHESSGIDALHQRSQLVGAFQELQKFLNENFRVC